MNAQADLERLRGLANRFVAVLLWTHIAFVAGAALVLDKGWIVPTAATFVCALLATGFARLHPRSGASRMISGVALMISVSILVSVFSGQKYQVDLHMYYFAALAMLVATCDWKAIAAAAATVALHHLLLNFLLPNLIYSGGADLIRFSLHALVLVMEAATLIWIAKTLERMFASLEAQALEVERARLQELVNQSEKAELAQKAEEERNRAQRERALVAEEQSLVVKSVAIGLSRLSDGDLVYRLDAPFAPAYEALRSDFNDAMEKLQDTMSTITINARGIHSGVDQISHASEDLSRRTEHQAASLEETAAALDQITATVQRTAHGAKEANGVVAAANQDAAHASDVVNRAVVAMSAIETSSHQITQIISVIDEIAFQTNLLALNAGVEAARAGDAGRGFAVVASEVRALAQRSAGAAKEIKTLISDSTQQVLAGVDLVGETGNSLRRMFDQVNQISRLVTDIAASAQEQSTGLNEVNTAVNQMDQVTQQNAAMVEQSSAASLALSQEAEQLTALISQFNVGAIGDAKRPAPRNVVFARAS